MVMHRLALNITVASLQRGQHIECKDLDEVLEAEEALNNACQNLRTYLRTAATFDGREMVIDYTEETPKVVSAPALATTASLIAHAPIIDAVPATDTTLVVAATGPALPSAPELDAPYLFKPASAGSGSELKETVIGWWENLTHEQRKWIVIGGGIVLAILLLKFT